MHIEVTASRDEPQQTVKGNLLEQLAEELLRVQGYTVSTQVRVTASELDLLCTHKVSGKQIYVECKAHRDTLSANILTNLLGTVEFHDYSEGWLISTGPLGKDAKGFLSEWEQKTREKRERLSIYHPHRVIDALVSAKMLLEPPSIEASRILSDQWTAGEWTLLISPWGRYWACPTLVNGVPSGVLVFHATNGSQILDDELLIKLNSADSSLVELDFSAMGQSATEGEGQQPRTDEQRTAAVVEVEFGEKWTDYRPARPEHFVGRVKVQRSILRFFADVKKRRTDSRVFAVKGDSGLGKSSLVAKLRAVAQGSKKPGKLFLYAVDVRAASNSSYVYASFLAALRNAASNGFGTQNDLQVSNYADPLQSDSIRQFLAECERKHELVILVFDQFEELYSKPALFPVFDEIRKLMFSALSASTNLVLGFAWKTDTTVPQDHPAYHMWHQLADHRYEVFLSPFSHADAEHSLRLFESELGERLRPELRRYLIENSQGYPWLLKKLCIHLYDQMQAGSSQSQLEDTALDIGSLFDRDLSDLTAPQTACVKLVAEHAPIDWYEVLETAGADVVRELQQRRLVIRRGDKLNLYWDIFRDYVLAGTVPSIPFTYIPQAPSIAALLRVALQLDPAEPKTLAVISKKADFSESTVRNIIHDLEQFGIAQVQGDSALLDSHMKELDPSAVLARIRVVFRRHALTSLLKENNSAKPAYQAQLVQYLKRLNPTAQHHSRTWKTYANRMCLWMSTLGYLQRRNSGFLYDDRGDISREDAQHFRGERKRVVFIGDASPSRVVEALDYLQANGAQSFVRMKSLGFRNACAVLYRFQLIELTPAHDYRVVEGIIDGCSSTECVWEKVQKEDAVMCVVEHLLNKPVALPVEIGRMIAERFERTWTKASCVRVGNSLRQWARWLMSSRDGGKTIPPPPGRRRAIDGSTDHTLDLFASDEAPE